MIRQLIVVALVAMIVSLQGASAFLAPKAATFGLVTPVHPAKPGMVLFAGEELAKDVQDGAEKAGDKVTEAVDTASENAEAVGDNASKAATEALDNAKELGSEATEKAKEAGDKASSKIDEATS